VFSKRRARRIAGRVFILSHAELKLPQAHDCVVIFAAAQHRRAMSIPGENIQHIQYVISSDLR